MNNILRAIRDLFDPWNFRVADELWNNPAVRIGRGRPSARKLKKWVLPAERTPVVLPITAHLNAKAGALTVHAIPTAGDEPPRFAFDYGAFSLHATAEQWRDNFLLGVKGIAAELEKQTPTGRQSSPPDTSTARAGGESDAGESGASTDSQPPSVEAPHPCQDCDSDCGVCQTLALKPPRRSPERRGFIPWRETT